MPDYVPTEEAGSSLSVGDHQQQKKQQKQQQQQSGDSDTTTSPSLKKTKSVLHSRTSSGDSTDGLLLSVANLTGKNKKSSSESSLMGQVEPEPTVNVSDAAYRKLQAELEVAQEALKVKDAEIRRLSAIQDKVESEVEELTASLFEEAHKMVREANVRAASSEKGLIEAKMQIDGLTNEVSALKVMVLTSTPSNPNKHLHPQIDSRSRKEESSSASSAPPSSSSSSSSSSTVVTTSEAALTAQKWSNGLSNGTVSEFNDKLNIDPVFRKEYMAWKKSPSLERKDHPFLERLYEEDIDVCLKFQNESLAVNVLKSIEENRLSISPLSKCEDLPKNCALLDSPMLCKYVLRLGASSSSPSEAATEPESDDEYYISQLARNRIIAVCDCLNYLRYVTQGLVKSHSNDVYWEIIHLRKKILLARLGFKPD